MNSLKNLIGKTVVVTGASGYIGSVLVDALVKHSSKVIRVSRIDLVPLADTKTIKADIRNSETWTDLVAQADIIYHLAGNTSVYEAANNPMESLNSTLLPINHLVLAARTQHCKPRVVFASTATVYGLTSQLPVAERLEPKPITIYDLHKLFAEQQLALATKQGVLEGVSLRLANVYGPSTSVSSADDRGVLNRVTAKAFSGENLTVYGGGNYLRDYIYITDVVYAFLFAGVCPQLSGNSFNVGSGVGTTVREAFVLSATQASRITGRIVDVLYESWPDSVAPIELRSFTADIEKYASLTGWGPRVKLETGIAQLLTFLLKMGR